MKAVIMAGGEGSRLRPLTCTLPKPLAPLCGKPVLEYIFDLLLRHGVDEAALTLGYLAGMIEEQYGDGYRQLRLGFVTEETPLGTAGGVALAARHWDEPFLVISGDAMCDLDLSHARRQHARSGAAVTILGMEVDDPREYGLMQTDAEGRVMRFIEKPAWGQVTTNLANTGIYLLRPDVMALVPEGRPFDFAKDLFPLLMERGEDILCCAMAGYWCDIGDLGAYLRCQRDMLDRKVQCALPAAAQTPQGDFDLLQPVCIAGDVTIAPGAVIGPYAVLGDGCSVGAQAKIRGSVLLQNVSIAAGASLTGAVVCAGASVRGRAQLFEGCAVGEGAVIGAGTVLHPEAAVWPHKQAEDGAAVRGHVKYGSQPAALFGDSGFGGGEGLSLTPETCAALGCAVGSIKSCKKTGVACDGTGTAKALALALMGGLMSAGSHVWSFGGSFPAQLQFFTAFCGLGLGLYIQGGSEPSIHVCGEGGLPAPRYLEREIETRLRRGDYHLRTGDACKEIADMSSIRMMYSREMIKQAPEGLEGLCAQVRCGNPAVQELLEDALARLGCGIGGGPLLTLDEAGVSLTAQEDGLQFSAERLLAICCRREFLRGCDIALPYDAPEMLDALAAHAGRSTLRYLSSPADQSDAAARRLSARQVWVRDGLFRAVKLLAILKETGLSLTQLSAQLPPFYVESKRFILPCPPSALQKLLGGHEAVPESAREGIVLRRQGGRILITPGKSGRRVSVLAEAETMEIAKELCDGIEKILTPSS